MKIAELFESQKIKQRLDPKCWAGWHKKGTKIKGGVRVNNCVKNEDVNNDKSNKSTLDGDVTENFADGKAKITLYTDPNYYVAEVDNLAEGLAQETVHKNPSVATLKALAKNNKYHSARFVVYNDGTVVAADSENFTHHSMAPAMGAWVVRGYVQYLGDNDYAYRSMEVYSALNKDHPVFREWEKAGIVNGNPDVVEENFADSRDPNYIGDSNPLGLPWIDTWHRGQEQALAGDRSAINTMLQAAREAQKESPGEAKYYRGTVAWLQAKYDVVKQLINDPDVRHTGNDQVLRRLLNNQGKDYKTAYNAISENFADGRGPSRPGDSQRHGIPKNATMAQLEKAARAPGRKGQLARWQINMRRGKKKSLQELFDPNKLPSGVQISKRDTNTWSIEYQDLHWILALKEQ